MKVYVKGQALDLTQRDYVGAGGEGTIYSRGGVAFKVYLNPAKMIPTGKIQELSSLSDPHIIKPEDILTDGHGKPIGYTMRFVKDTWALCQLFPRVFRDRNGVTHEMISALVRKLQEGVDHVHKAGVLLVDLNEMNFLVAKRFDDLFFIDADSYQTPHYPATAFMPSIRDWKTPIGKFTTDSDWFSFGIVSFQMFTGIHPYKGRHPKVLGLDDRMQAGISVFNKDVGIPAIVYPFDVIPKPFRAWYEAIFEKGVRCPPPSEFGAVIVFVPVVKTIKGTTLFDLTELHEYDGPITRMWTSPHDDHLIVVTDKSVWLDNHRINIPVPSAKAAVGFTARSARAVFVYGGTATPTLVNADDGSDIPFGVEAEEISCHEGRIYLRMTDKVLEVILTEAGSKVIASTREVVQVMEHATRLYPGVVVQKMLGSTFVSLLTDSGKANQVRMSELDKYRILDAKYERGVLMVVGEKGGKYDRLVFRFDEGFDYDARVEADISPNGLNFTVLDTGVCACMTEDETIEVFSNRKAAIAIKSLVDPAIGGDMMLGHQGGIIVAQGNKVYRMKMKGAKP